VPPVIVAVYPETDGIEHDSAQGEPGAEAFPAGSLREVGDREHRRNLTRGVPRRMTAEEDNAEEDNRNQGARNSRGAAGPGGPGDVSVLARADLEPADPLEQRELGGGADRLPPGLAVQEPLLPQTEVDLAEGGIRGAQLAQGIGVRLQVDLGRRRRGSTGCGS